MDETNDKPTDDNNTTSKSESALDDGLAALAAKIQQHVDEWAPRLGLDAWDIKVKCTADLAEMPEAGTSDVQPRYRRMILNFNLLRVLSDYDDLEELVVHELCHYFTWRIWDQVVHVLNASMKDANWAKVFEWHLEEFHEQATTEIADSLLRTKRSLGNGEK